MNGLETRLRQIITNLGGTLPEQGSHLGVYLNAIIVALGGTARPVNDSLEAFLKNILELKGGTKGTSADPLKAYLDGILATLPGGEPLADTTLKDYLDAFIARTDAYVHIKCADLTITRSDTRKFITEQLNDFIHCDDGTKPEGISTNDPTVEIRTYNTSTTAVKNIFAGLRNLIMYPNNRYLTYFYGFNSDTVEDFKEEIKDLVLTYRVKSDVYNIVKIKDLETVFNSDYHYLFIKVPNIKSTYATGANIVNNTTLANHSGDLPMYNNRYRYQKGSSQGDAIIICDTAPTTKEEFLAKYGNCTFFYEKQ